MRVHAWYLALQPHPDMQSKFDDRTSGCFGIQKMEDVLRHPF